MSVEVLLPSPRVNMLDTGTLNPIEGLALPTVCGPHRGVRRPSGTNDSESDSPPSKKSKKGRRRKKRPRQRLTSKGLRTKPVAPFNTTQFLMAEHDQLQDTDIVVRPRRQRDSSFSVDSDDQEFYSSPEDEDEFMAREFWNAYEDVHAERLDTMTKAQLVQEYLALEEKVDLLERQVRVLRARHRQHKMEDDDDDDEEEMRPGEVKVDSETAQKITIFQKEISSLTNENRKLREENLTLRRNSSARSSSSSTSSSSDSSTSSSSSSSDSSSDSDSEDERRTSKKPLVRLPLPRTRDGDEVIVSASEKVEYQHDTRVCQEKIEMEKEAAPTVAEAVVLHDSLQGSPAHPDPPTSSSTSLYSLDKGDVDDEAVPKGVEEEVSSTTTT